MSYLTSNLNLQNSAINASVQNYTEVTIARKAVLTNKPLTLEDKINATLEIVNGGTGYTDEVGVGVTANSGSGSGMLVTIIADGGGAIVDARVVTLGLGYKNDDSIVVTTGNVDSILRLSLEVVPTEQGFTGRIEESKDLPIPLESKTTVPPARGVNTLSSIQSFGTAGYTTATNVPTKAYQSFSSALQYVDSTGVGLTVNITAVAGSVTAVSICNPGRNYNVGDLITILQSSEDATVSVQSLLGAPLAKTHEPGFIQLDQGGYQLPTGSWGEFMEIYSVSNTGGTGGANHHLLVTTKTPHGLSPNDKVDINDLPGLNINNFTVIGVKDENTFEINNTQAVLPLPGTITATIRARRAKAAPSQAGMNMLPKSSISITKNIPFALLSLQTNMPGSSISTSTLPKTVFGSDELGVDFSLITAASLIGNGLPGVPPTVANLTSIYPDFNTMPANAVNTPVFCPEIFGQVGNSFGISHGMATTEASALLQLNLNYKLYTLP
jgi:hypothetical protein